MKRLATLLFSSVMIFGIACGDNVTGPDDGAERDEVMIIPHAGEALTALESAEEIGFSDAVYLADADMISAFGDIAWADEAREMPGIADVLPADEIRPLDPSLGVDLREPSRGRDITGLALDSAYAGADRDDGATHLSDLAITDGGKLSQ